jgi:hypothetical protein
MLEKKSSLQKIHHDKFYKGKKEERRIWKLVSKEQAAQIMEVSVALLITNEKAEI